MPNHSPRFSSQFPPLFVILLMTWGLINLLQSAFTEIGHDEAYYWMYAQYLDWGYFDHPPMIALMIKTGSLLFDGELGARLMTVVAQLITLCLLWYLTGQKNAPAKHILLFFGIAASVVMFQVYGFVTTPDAPLLLFTTLFLTAYYHFIQKENLGSILLLAIAMAGLMYSKYHGALVISFVVLSNIRLLLHWRFWLAGMIALLLLTPHLLWQFQHDFPTFQYHLVSRSRPFSIKYILQFIPNQLSTFNPFFFGLAIFLLFKFTARDTFERALYFLIAGFLVFFFVSSFRGRVEAHWTIAACIPMILIVFNRTLEHRPSQKYVYRLLFPSIFLLLIMRLALIVDFLPVDTKYHGQKAWAMHLSDIAGDKPVVFRNSYQKPSLYRFYSAKPTTTLNSIYYRQNQYDLWNFEKSFWDQSVILVANQYDSMASTFDFPDGRREYLRHASSFQHVQKLSIQYHMTPGSITHTGDTISMEIEIFNPETHQINFIHDEFPVSCIATFITGRDQITDTLALLTPPILHLESQEKRNVNVQFVVPDLSAGSYSFCIALSAGILQQAYNSSFTEVKILKKVVKD